MLSFFTCVNVKKKWYAIIKVKYQKTEILPTPLANYLSIDNFCTEG